MAAKIIPKRSTTVGAIPDSTVLDIGELAVNATDGIIFTKLPDGNVVNLSGAPELHNHQISQIVGLQTELDSKVNKIDGKQLSSRDYTALEKDKLAGIEEGAEANVGTDLGQSRTSTTYTITSSTGANTTLQTVTTQLAGVVTAADKIKIDNLAANSVFSVNGAVGDVVLTTNEIDEGTDNLYYTDTRAISAIKNDVDWKDTNWNTAYNWGDHSVAGYELASNKGIANGYAGLDGTGKVPSAQLPSFDDILEYASESAFPATGETGKFYVALDTNKVFRWSGSSYVYITSGAIDSVNSKTGVVVLGTDDIDEGSTNLYYTDARATNAIKADADWNDTEWNTAYGWGDHSLAGYELSSNKGVANGYAGLDTTGKVPSAQLPSFVDDVLEYSSEAAFPTTGETGKLYVALDTDKVYRWSGSVYVYITSGAVDTVNGKDGVVVLGSDDIGEGSNNLYYTDARATTAIKNDPTWNASNWDSAYGWGDHSLAGYELSSNKGVANGYAGLDGSGTVPAAQLPSSVYEILEYSSQAAFPATGETGKLYVALDTDKLFRWTGSAYVATSGSVDSVNGYEGIVDLSTSDINEGTNLYHTTTRARNSVSATGDLAYNVFTGVFSFNETYSTPAELLTAIKTVDGSGSGLDADTLDGINSTGFARNYGTPDAFVVQNYAEISSTPSISGAGNDAVFTSIQGSSWPEIRMVDTKGIAVRLSGDSGGSWTSIIEAYTDGTFTFQNNEVWHSGNDGVASGMDADLLDGQHGEYYRNATNLNAGTVATARLPASALIGDTTYTGGTGITLSGTTFLLSDERYTLTEKNKLGGIETGAEVNLVNSVNNKTGFVTITQGDVGLGSVRNVASYSQTESDNRYVNDTGDSMTGIYSINTADDGVNDLQVGGNVSLRGQTGFGTENPTHTVDVAGSARMRDENPMKFGGSGPTDSKYAIKFNSATNSLDFNFTG